MFSFFKKKPKDTPVATEEPVQQTKVLEPEPAAVVPPAQPAEIPVDNNPAGPPRAEQKQSWFDRFRGEPTATPVAPPVEKQEAPVAPPPVEQKSWLNRIKGDPALAPAIPPAEEQGEIVPAAPPPAEQKQSWLNRLKTGLSKTSSNLTTLFVGAKIGDELYEELESALLVSDAGVDATQFLLDALKKKVKDEKLTEGSQVKAALRSLLIDMLKPLQKPLVLGRHQPLVMMIAGVNGAGKTTTIGKLAKHLQTYEQSVLLAAGDTFRAAAREQLTIWGERNNVAVIAQESGDPAAVAFDAVQSAKARGLDVVMVDTAGRLPTQLHLMEELKKVKRVVGKGMDGAPHEILLVIDGNTGQNALAQVKAFDDALQLTGLVITKLDGTAKGGVLAAIAKTRPVPVYFIGIGEKIEDLQPFNAEEFVDALLS
jgi:fused signal recognition particle receptor